MKTEEQIKELLARWQKEYENTKTLVEDSATWFSAERFANCDRDELRATCKTYTDVHDRCCKFAGAIAVLKIILDEPSA